MSNNVPTVAYAIHKGIAMETALPSKQFGPQYKQPLGREI